MQIANRFWKESFKKEVIVDWDDFINCFSEFTERNSKILLNEHQKSFLKELLDPQERQEIDIGQCMNFMSKYWVVPSNRTNLFKLKFKPPQKKQLDDWQGLQIKIRGAVNVDYTMKLASLKKGAAGTPLKTKQFCKVGSAEGNDIKLEGIFMNPVHLKLVNVADNFLVRDVARSSRCKLKIDRTLLLKTGMVVSVGDYDLIVEAANGGQGPTETQSIYIDLNMKTIDPKQLYLSYGLEAPLDDSEPVSESVLSEVPGQEEIKIVNRGPLELIVVNRRTQEHKEYRLEQITKIGKSPVCRIQLPDIKVPLHACTLQYSMDTWMLKPQDNAELFVYLANREQLTQNRPSNLQLLQKDYSIVAAEYQLTFDYLLQPEEY